MLQLEIKHAQELFFYDRAGRARIQAGVDRARHRALNRGGALVRTIARISMRKARRQRISELSEEQRIQFQIRSQIAKREGRKKPTLPFAASQPGEPPRVRSGHLKQFLFYAFDSKTKSVVVGPVRLNGQSGDVPGILEYGGVSEGSRIAARPYMRPAEEVARSQYVHLWKDAIM